SALSTRTWVQQRSLSNRLMLMRCSEGVDFHPESCKIHALLAQLPAVPPRKSRNWMRGATQLVGWAKAQRAHRHLSRSIMVGTAPTRLCPPYESTSQPSLHDGGNS